MFKEMSGEHKTYLKQVSLNLRGDDCNNWSIVMDSCNVYRLLFYLDDTCYQIKNNFV